MNRTTIFVVLSAILVWTASRLPASELSSEQQVTIDNFSFTPQVLTVKAGTSVTWTNKDDVPHTVVSTTKRFASRVLDTDEKYFFTFDEPGSYEYYCPVHPHMTGKIIVQ